MYNFTRLLKLSVAIAVFMLFAFNVKSQGQPEIIGKSIIQLIADPEKYNGKAVRIIGFLRLEFEHNALYLHKEDYENGLVGNGIWISINEEIEKKREKYNLQYVLIEGIFNSKGKGHLGQWCGQIENIKRVQVWSDPNNPIAKQHDK